MRTRPGCVHAATLVPYDPSGEPLAVAGPENRDPPGEAAANRDTVFPSRSILMGREANMPIDGHEPGVPGSDFDMTRSMWLAWQGQRGDTGAVNELLTRYIPRMRRVVSIKVGWRHARIDPEDV